MTGIKSGGIRLDFSGYPVKLTGMSEAVASQFQTRWRKHVIEGDATPVLDGRITVRGEPFLGRELTVKRMSSRFGERSAFFRMEEGSVFINDSGEAEFNIAPATDQINFFAIINLLLAALSYVGPRNRFLVMHSAGIVLDGSSFLLVGAEDAGKTTWAELSEAAGARILSDDVVFVEISDDRAHALGSPYRQYGSSSVGTGRWPLAAVLLPAHGERAALEQVSALASRARVAANLPFVNERIGVDPFIDKLVDRLVRSVPFRTLTFAKDTTFIPLLRRFGSSGGFSRGR